MKELFKQNYYCTDIMYLYLICSITYGVNLYLDLQNIDKLNWIELNWKWY
jgi:hypothetical protein